MAPSDTTKGSTVVYETRGKAYNAIALSDAKISIHPGVKRAGIYLDLIYLTEGGVPTTVLSAPVMLTALTPEQLSEVVNVELQARRKDHRRTTLKENGGDLTVADLVEEFGSTQQPTGWRPAVESSDVLDIVNHNRALAAELATALADGAELKSKLDAMTAERDQLRADLSFAAGKIAGLTEQAPTSDDKPSAADLDAAAAEQQAAAQTTSASATE